MTNPGQILTGFLYGCGLVFCQHCPLFLQRVGQHMFSFRFTIVRFTPKEGYYKMSVT